jgi:hypothetical protein
MVKPVGVLAAIAVASVVGCARATTGRGPSGVVDDFDRFCVRHSLVLDSVGTSSTRTASAGGGTAAPRALALDSVGTSSTRLLIALDSLCDRRRERETR